MRAPVEAKLGRYRRLRSLRRTHDSEGKCLVNGVPLLEVIARSENAHCLFRIAEVIVALQVDPVYEVFCRMSDAAGLSALRLMGLRGEGLSSWMRWKSGTRR